MPEGAYVTSGPYYGGEAVDISSTDHTISGANASRGVYITTGGNIKVAMVEGQDLTITGVPDDTTLPLAVTKVYRTGTTASGMFLFW